MLYLKWKEIEMRTHLSELETKELLGAYGIEVPKEALASNEEEAVQIAGRLGYPLVLKSVSPDIKSRSASGCMALDISSEDELKERFREIIDRAKVQKILIQEALPRAREVVIGMMRDDALGPVLMFSLGGVFADVIKDISFRPSPVTKEDALEMIREIKAYPILEGSRGGGISDIGTIADVISRVSKMGVEQKGLVELEINPLFVYDKGAVAVNARAVFERKE